MAENNQFALENERRRLNQILYEEHTKLLRYLGNDADIPRYSKLLFAGQVIFFVVLLVSVLPNVSFLLDWDQPMKKSAFAVTAVCMAGLLILLTVHIVLNVRRWIGGIRREAALNRLRREIESRIRDIEKEQEKIRNAPPAYIIAGEQKGSDMNAEYEFHIPSPFHDVKPDNTRLNLARERTRLDHEADRCVLSLRTEIMDIDADYQKNVFVGVLRSGQYLTFAGAMISFWAIKRTAMLAFIAAGIGLVLPNAAIWLCYRNRKAKRTRYWNSRKAEFEDQKRAVTIELPKLDQ